MPTIFTAGPVLIRNGIAVKQAVHSFNDNRYCRTGAGVTNNGHLILVVVDGNNAEAAGMTINELANKKFDHYGERKVANALVIKLK